MGDDLLISVVQIDSFNALQDEFETFFKCHPLHLILFSH
jgi:hypothetical protein